MRFSIATAFAVVGTTLAADHLVVVGNNSELVFEPDNIQAAEGDTVTFKFWPKNHSVAQAAFNAPCEPAADGFWSGYIPSTEKAAATTFMYTVENASRPIWFYCTQGKHCQGGMVGVINGPSTGNTLERFKSASANATANVSPNSTAGTNGMLMQNGTMGNGTTNENAASALSASSGLAVAGFLGAFFYAVL